MTFTEAAVEILRLVGRPLHYKKITELAIERNLLSHVGKAPELTMSSRLATMVKKDRGDEPIVKVKPGIFALRDFTPEMLALADSDDDIDLSSLPPPDATPPAPAAPEPGEASEAPARGAHPGSEVFPEEEDDDQPILGGLDADEESDDKEDKDDARRGRRRRRRGRRDEEGAAEASAPAPERSKERGDRDRDRGRGRDRERGDRDRDRDRPRRDRDRDRDRDRGRGDAAQVDMNREPAEGDVLGRDLADAAISVLASSRDAVPLTYAEIAAELVRRGRLAGDASALAPTVAAAIRADSRRRERSRLRHVEGRVALTEWFLPRDVVQQERDLARCAERLQDRTHRAFMRKVSDLPAAGFVELMATWLNAEGVGSLRGVRRPSSGADVHLAGVSRRGPEEIRCAVVLVRDGREVTRERVVELRGSLPHYGGAMVAWIVSTGPVSRGAREEAALAGAAPVAIYDGAALASAMEAAGVGIRPVPIALPTIDLDLLDLLRGRPEAAARDRVDAEREPRENREREPRENREREPREARERGPKPAPEAEGEAAEQAAPADASAPEGEERGGRRRRRRRRRGAEREDTGAAEASAQPAEAAESADAEESPGGEESGEVLAAQKPAGQDDAAPADAAPAAEVEESGEVPLVSATEEDDAEGDEDEDDDDDVTEGDDEDDDDDEDEDDELDDDSDEIDLEIDDDDDDDDADPDDDADSDDEDDDDGDVDDEDE